MNVISPLVHPSAVGPLASAYGPVFGILFFIVVPKSSSDVSDEAMGVGESDASIMLLGRPVLYPREWYTITHNETQDVNSRKV